MRQANVTTQHAVIQEWNAIDWQIQDQRVRNLRYRIYRASEAGDIKRVRNLQKLMLRSTANKLVAIRRVTQRNHGRNTPGIDKVTIRTDKERISLYHKLELAHPGVYYPVKRVYIPKKKGKRPLGLPTIFDRCRQAIVLNALEPHWEAKFEATSYGFRPGRSAHDAIEKIFCIANASKTRKWILDADIKGAFDNIDHCFLLNQLHGFPGKQWIALWLKAGVMENQQWSPSLAGTPQGGIISPLLANIALHGMEETLNVKRNSLGHLLSGCPTVVRYADDFVVFHETKEGCESAQLQLQSWLAERGLELSKEKTHIRHIAQGFDFLGFNIRHYPVNNRKQPYIFLAKPSRSSIKSFRSSIKQVWKQCQSLPIQQAVQLLNPKIRGWTNYFRIGSAKDIFASLDYWMWLRQQRFLTRRHPTKSKRWLVDHYWGEIQGRKDRWVFQDKITGDYLLKLAWTSIERHTLIQGNASPDNPALQDYWKKRRSKQSFKKKKWKKNQDKCSSRG